MHDDSGGALVALAYLKSYEHMGVMQVHCVSGCACADGQVDGHNALERNSQTALFRFATTRVGKRRG